jgi:N-methylhydantoinase B
MGDLDAQLSAIALSQKRIDALLNRFGTDIVRECTAQIFRNSEQRYREFIRQIPDGVYTAEGISDNDGTDDEPVVVKVKVTIAGDEIIVDATGSSVQRRGNLNTGYANTVSAVRLGLALLYPDPLPDVNDGSFRAMRVIAEPGSIFAATEPAPCMRPHPVMLLIDLMIKALAPVLPKVVAAGLPGDSWNVFIMDNGGGAGFCSGEALDGGWGASDACDGASAVIHSAAGDFRNMPVETMESRYPIRIRRLQLGCDSGGAGRHRGGLNVVKEYELLADSLVTLHFDRAKMPSWGLFGGEAGASPRVEVQPVGEPPCVVHKVEQLALPRGSTFVCVTGGGGGFGAPEERNPEAVLEDVLDGYVSSESALERYRVALTDDGRGIDWKRTARRSDKTDRSDAA